MRIVICVVQALPLWVCEYGAGVLATLFCRVLRIRGKVIDENLRFAYPEMTERQRRQLAWRMWEHLFLFATEVAHTGRKVQEHNWRDYVKVVGEATLVERMLDDRPLLLVTAHYGNFELATYMLSLFGYRVYSVARPLDNPYLDRFVNGFRGSKGQTILSKQDDYDRILEILGEGGAVSFVADQYAGHKGCWVRFFNRQASAHKAIALFALNHDAPMAVGHCRRVGKPLHCELHLQSVADPRNAADEAGSISQLTQWYHGEFEKLIRESPEQYWWLHRRWKDNRQKRKAARQAAKAA